MNDNHPDRPDDRTAEECERHAEEATTAAIRAAAKLAEIRDSDPLTARALVRNVAKFAGGALDSMRKASERRL